MTELADSTIDLLQHLIRNACVNDGTVESGNELRSVDLLDDYLAGAGLDIERYEPAPGRGSLVARIEGSDPEAPSVCLMGHTDVVPVNPDGWDHDPFGGEIIDGEVWGRGAIDMLNLTSSMAVAFRHLAESGYRPRGDLIYFAVADEEAGGTWGAEWMLEHEHDAVMADYVLTEMGGFGFPHAIGRSVVINVAEKGSGGVRLTVAGTPGHGSMPFGADNALLKAAEVLRRLGTHRPLPQLDDLWVGLLDTLGLDGEMRAATARPRTRLGHRRSGRGPRRQTPARLLAHVDLTQRGTRRAEAERDPRFGQHRRRHPDAARSGRELRARGTRPGDR